jgi:tight adherence protein B
MSGISLAAGLLALAVLVAPGGPHGRIAIPVRHRCSRRALATGSLAVLAAATAVSVPAPALVAGAVAAAAVVGRIRRRRRMRLRLREGRALAAALELLTGELRVGAHPIAAFAVAASESVGGVGDSLRAVASRAQLGADVADGIRAAAGASPVPQYWNRLAVCWDLAAEHGLPMSVLMRTAHRDIVDRQRFADRTHAALAGARATAAILAALPLLGVLFGQLIGAEPLRFLLGGGLGGALLIIGVTFICAGVAWADRIIDRLMA